MPSSLRRPQSLRYVLFPVAAYVEPKVTVELDEKGTVIDLKRAE